MQREQIARSAPRRRARRLARPGTASRVEPGQVDHLPRAPARRAGPATPVHVVRPTPRPAARGAATASSAGGASRRRAGRRRSAAAGAATARRASRNDSPPSSSSSSSASRESRNAVDSSTSWPGKSAALSARMTSSSQTNVGAVGAGEPHEPGQPDGHLDDGEAPARSPSAGGESQNARFRLSAGQHRERPLHVDGERRQRRKHLGLEIRARPPRVTAASSAATSSDADAASAQAPAAASS